MKKIGLVLVALLVAGCFFIFPAAAVSMEEVESFLANDTTSERAYNGNQMPYYTCGHFTQDLVRNASQEGIRMYPLYLTSRVGCDHIMAAVDVNGSWVFIEPISDGVYPEETFWALKKVYRSYRIGTSVRCSPYSQLNRVNGFVEWRMF